MITDIEHVYQQHQDDPRPLPVIIADVWGFELQRHESDGGTFYAVQDWIAGLTTSDPIKAGELFRKMDQSRISVPSLPYTASDGKTYQRDYTDDRGLYWIAQQLRTTAKRPALEAIKRFLARAGALVDDQRLNPDHALDAGIAAYEQMGKPSAWIGERLDGKIARKAFMAALDHAVASTLTGKEYGQATDTIYTGLWNRTAAQLRGELGLKKSQSLRDHQPSIALAYQRIAEETAARKLGDREALTWLEARGIVAAVATVIGAQAKQTGDLLNIDLATGKPLLNKGE